ncbi:MAG: 3-phosphoserine/phosphohydroxythreonine transaminase [Defluviitaleaceae bacterium]|nr:3-phosphoserine/phosphohydroxythreonine transaminase [Defluviitaleaceae bacterium]
MKRVYNFSAGPAMLPEAVLMKAQSEMLDYEGSGMSIMEMSHRGKMVRSIFEEAEGLFRELMEIPENYQILFCQGGASLQFSMLPFNLYKNGVADFLITGNWSEKAKAEVSRYMSVNVVGSSKDRHYAYIPEIKPEKLTPNADFYHYTANNTIYGTAVHTLPMTDAPIVADMTSAILAKPYDVSKHGLIYAGAQKQFGIAGLTVAIVRDDLIGNAKEETPTMLNYKTYANNESMYNTPPVYAVYLTLLVLRWYKETFGTLAKVQEHQTHKTGILYDFLDQSALFHAFVDKEARSTQNVTFGTKDDALDKLFVDEAAKVGLVNLGGYRTIGGMRASIYTPHPLEGVLKLVEFMKEFEVKHSV